MSLQASVTKSRELFKRILALSSNKSHRTILRCYSTENKIKRFAVRLNDRLKILTQLFAIQCNFIAAQRIRRTFQMVNLYYNLGYNSSHFKNFFQLCASSFYKSRRVPRLFAALGASVLFNWDEQKINDDEIESCAGEIAIFNKMQDNAESNKEMTLNEFTNEKWETIITAKNLLVYRRPLENSYLYEYKVFGSFFDVSARAFFSVQADLGYRKEWDKLVVDLDVVDRNDDGSEVVHWVTHFPYPMYRRDYLYIRKSVVDPHRKLMIMVSRATDHPKKPITDEYVRVSTYRSEMCIKPHTNFDDNGFDYILTYYDDPKGNFPSAAYRWMASKGVPDFVEKLHKAALTYQSRYPNANMDRLKKKKHILYEDDSKEEDCQKVPM
ncbi:DgyrCDS10223 [Dimorphilus gyrociliatus]|uniref:Phosphatidylcholine transfer protein n=1 Tax=Dimorphilus gyrociliatus TaxID=2664684 RepID=A0A7I8W0R9_9ANNE|nr:DgyrCDS10223 [Dimorphilus gyrociliatus]